MWITATTMLEAPQHCSLCKESRATRGRRELFLKAVSVWINKPHVVNRRLCGSTVHHVRRCNTKTEAEKALIELKESSKDRREGLTQWEEGHTFKELSEEKHPYIVIVRELIPKSEFFPRLQEALLYGKTNLNFFFFFKLKANFGIFIVNDIAFRLYRVQYVSA